MRSVLLERGEGRGEEKREQSSRKGLIPLFFVVQGMIRVDCMTGILEGGGEERGGKSWFGKSDFGLGLGFLLEGWGGG